MTDVITVKSLEPLDRGKYLAKVGAWWKPPHVVFNCDAKQQMPGDNTGGEFMCPIIGKEVKIDMGVCRANCEHRSW